MKQKTDGISDHGVKEPQMFPTFFVENVTGSILFVLETLSRSSFLHQGMADTLYGYACFQLQVEKVCATFLLIRKTCQ